MVFNQIKGKIEIKFIYERKTQVKRNLGNSDAERIRNSTNKMYNMNEWIKMEIENVV